MNLWSAVLEACENSLVCFCLFAASLSFLNIQSALDTFKAEMTHEEVVAATKQCANFRSDYMECLHGEKTFGRSAALARAAKVAAGDGH